MPIIETLYQLTERDTSKVSGLWKGLQIIGYIVASASAFVTTISFYNLVSGFSMNCVLYTEVEFRKLKPEDKKYKEMVSNGTNVTIDSLTTIWNRDWDCQYCLVVWTMSFVGGIILGAFFILNPKGGKGYSHSIFTQPWKMVIPVIVVSLFMVILTSIASVSSVKGINHFCGGFVNYTGNTSCSKNIDVYTLKYHDEIQPINRLQKIVKGGSVMAFIAWICCVGLLLIRLCLAPDFNLQIINMIPTERRLSESLRKKIYSQPSDAVLPIFPLARIHQLPVSTETDENLEETSNSKDKESANTEQPKDARKSSNQRSSNKNDENSNAYVLVNNNDTYSPLPPNNSYDSHSLLPPNNSNDRSSAFPPNNSNDPNSSLLPNDSNDPNNRLPPNNSNYPNSPLAPNNINDSNSSLPLHNSNDPNSPSPPNNSKDSNSPLPSNNSNDTNNPLPPNNINDPNSPLPPNSSNDPDRPLPPNSNDPKSNIKNIFFKML